MINVIIVSISSRENYPRYEERPLIIPAALSNAAFKMMEHLQNKQFKLIIDISCGTDIPLDDLPNNIVELKCPDLGIHKLPGPLGNGLKIIRCENNNIHQICDGELPPSLLALNCNKNQIVKMPSTLPDGLRHFNCYENRLTHLPDKLPAGIRHLQCGSNKISCLPDIIPPIKMFWCNDNNLHILPDFVLAPPINPYGEANYIFNCYSGNKLDTLYPELHDICYHKGKYKYDENGRMYSCDESIIMQVKYINRRNREIRAEWLAKINVGDVFLERYMQRMMHPSRLTALLADPNIDVDAFMESYVAGL